MCSLRASSSHCNDKFSQSVTAYRCTLRRTLSAWAIIKYTALFMRMKFCHAPKVVSALSQSHQTPGAPPSAACVGEEDGGGAGDGWEHRHRFRYHVWVSKSSNTCDDGGLYGGGEDSVEEAAPEKKRKFVAMENGLMSNACSGEFIDGRSLCPRMFSSLRCCPRRASRLRIILLALSFLNY